jgi:predicted RNA-binding protein with PUA-like domain
VRVPSYWLIKSEPSVYPWAKLAKERRTRWDGIRSFEARNNLRAMKAGDLVLFYHSNVGKELVGVARVSREAFPDPTAEEGDWSAVEIEPEYPLKEPVSLAQLKETKATSKMELVKKSRLSVTKVTAAEWRAVHQLAKT